jgi:hypothetical protein
MTREVEKMDKQSILSEQKKGMESVICEIELQEQSIEKTEEVLQSYLHVMKDILRLPDVTIVQTPNREKELIEPETNTLHTNSLARTEPFEKRESYVFQRKLKGGELQGIGCFVPERIVRALELEHGDFVYVTENVSVSDGRYKHRFEVAERRHMPPNEERGCCSYAIVEYDEERQQFFVEKDMQQNRIYVNGAPHRFWIPPKDAASVVQGDIIDLAYYKSSPDIVRVAWTYPSSFKNDFSKPARMKRKQEKNQKKEYVQTLEGKTILMVGFEPGRATIEEEITVRGGNFQWVHGKREREVTLRKMIRNADIVMLMLEHMGHGGATSGSKGVVRIAKELGVPFGTTHTLGRSSFVHNVHRILGIDSVNMQSVS